jgi:hypothetical protein
LFAIMSLVAIPAFIVCRNGNRIAEVGEGWA